MLHAIMLNLLRFAMAGAGRSSMYLWFKVAHSHCMWAFGSKLLRPAPTQCCCALRQQHIMAPKKQKAAKAQAVGAMVPVPMPGIAIATHVELHAGEKDNANLAYIERLANAWDVINDNDVFRGIHSELPLTISGSQADCGTQHPFDVDSCKQAPAASGTYTAGMNLFWIDLQWSSTPGVPLRMSAIEEMAKTMFKTPTVINEVHIAVPDPTYNPLMHRGALLRVSPEEITGAVVLAIARDITNNECDAVLRAWRRHVLSTSGRFQVLPAATDRYWYALQQREWFATVHQAVHRTTFQRLHEISRLMKKLRETSPTTEVTSASIADAYMKNLQMAAGSSGSVTLNFVDCCATITNKLLDVPDIARCMQDLDERSALTGIPNPFDSHTRLQAIIDKSRANNQVQLTWVMQGIWYHWRRGNIGALSTADIKGSAATGNRGLADLLLFKHQMKPVLLAKAATIFPGNADWWSNTVGRAAESYASWFEAEEAPDKAWRAGRELQEGKLLNYFGDVVFGKLYEGAIKTAVKSGKSPGDALHMPGLVEFLVALEEKVASQHKPIQIEAEPSSLPDTTTIDETDIVFHLPSTDINTPSMSVKASTVQDGPKREMLDSIITNTRQNVSAQITLVSQEPDAPHPHGLHVALMETPVGKLRGSHNEKDPGHSKYIGIFFDPKVSGEANHRPQWRMPPLRMDNYKRLIELARGRFGEAVGDDIPDGDLYFVMDGGKTGNQQDLLKPFASKPKSVKIFTLWRDEDSMIQRLQRVKGGIATYRQEEHLYIVSASTPALKPTKFQNYKGSTAGSMIGPIIMPSLDGLWTRSWPVKKEIFTAANMIAVGGRVDDDEDDSTVKAKPRDKDTIEPVFFHALPQTFYNEILGAIPLAGVVDLCPGDGALALAAYKRGICYTGLCFSDAHKHQLQAHIERSIFQAMSDVNDLIYEPRLVASLRDESQQPTAKAKAKATPKQKPAPQPTPAPTTTARTAKRQRPDEDEVGDEEDDDDEDALSGDA